MEGSGEAGEVFINWNVAEAKEPWQQSTSHQEDIYKINVNVNYEQEEAEEVEPEEEYSEEDEEEGLEPEEDYSEEENYGEEEEGMEQSYFVDTLEPPPKKQKVVECFHPKVFFLNVYTKKDNYFILFFC